MADQLTVGRRVRIEKLRATGEISRVAVTDWKRQDYLVDFVLDDGSRAGTQWFTAEELAPVAA